MSTPVSWDDLQFFLAVRDRGSVGAAARWLGVNHSTVLRHLASLETAMGQRLFDRLPSGYALTLEGQELAASLAGIGEQIESAQRRLGAGDPEVRGVVRVTVPDTVAHGMLMPHLAQFRRCFPLVELHVVVNNTALSLTQREADVAIRGTNQPPENLVGRRVGVVQTALYAARAYLDARGPDAGDTDHAWIGPDASLAHLASAKWLQRNVPAERVAVRLDSLVGIADAVSAGLGVGLVLCALGEARRELVRLAGPYPEMDTQLWVLTHPDLRDVRRIRVFVDFMVEALRSDPGVAPA